MSEGEASQRKSFIDHARGLAALPAEKLAELRAFGSEKWQETITAFQDALTPLRRAGYVLREFEVELGLTPKIIAHFVQAPAAESDAAAAQEALANNKIGAAMLSVLRRAGEAHKMINVKGFEFAHMEIDVGLLPAVRLRYRADDGAQADLLPG